MVETAHRKHPAWNSVQIAEHLDCTPEYIRATAKRRGWILGRKPASPLRAWSAGVRRNSPELSLQKSVKAFLDVALPVDSFWTSFPAGGGGKIRGAILKASGLVSGFPDLLVLYRGTPVMIELKAPKGKLSDPQKATIERLLKAGAQVFLCRSIDEVARDLKAAGIPLKANVPGEWLPRKVQNRSAA